MIGGLPEATGGYRLQDLALRILKPGILSQVGILWSGGLPEATGSYPLQEVGQRILKLGILSQVGIL